MGDTAKAELLNQVFASKFTDPSVTDVPQAPTYDLNPLRELHVSSENVRTILKGINPGKACGPDNVSARVIRECADESGAAGNAVQVIIWSGRISE